MSETNYAPSNRKSNEEIRENLKELNENRHILELLDSLPYIAALINYERQIVYCNKVLLTNLGQKYFEKVIGNRPGEILSCINSKNETGGCGTNKNCKYCGAVNAILDSQKKNQKSTYECRIISENDQNDTQWLDLAVTASPFQLKKTKYTVLTIADISDQKRRRALERIFFHDIINRVGSLSGYFELMRDISSEEKIKEFLDVAHSITVDLTEDIVAQRELLAAENNELPMNVHNISVRYVTTQAAHQMQNHEVARNKRIDLEKNINDYVFETDPSLLKRILINMLKNALEAIDLNDSVTIGYKTEEKGIKIYVRNNSKMSDDVKSQVFQRSFSTKGPDRGLGTYSMKLLGEKYLEGKVGFTSDEDEETVFYIILPFSLRQMK